MQRKKGECAIGNHGAGAVTTWKAVTMDEHFLYVSRSWPFALKCKFRDCVSSYCRYYSPAGHPEPCICVCHAPEGNSSADRESNDRKSKKAHGMHIRAEPLWPECYLRTNSIIETAK
ncbi:hypothetical protein D3C85_1617050 [compost metagenome]